MGYLSGCKDARDGQRRFFFTRQGGARPKSTGRGGAGKGSKSVGRGTYYI